MGRAEALKQLQLALDNNDKARFIRILEDFRATTAIVLFLILEDFLLLGDSQKARQWVVERVGGKTASKLLEKQNET